VRDQPTATPDPMGTHTCRHRFRAVCQIRVRPGYISRLRGFHEGPFLQNCVELFQRTQIRSIRRSVTRPVLQSLVVSLVLSRLDYGNAALAGLPARELSRLQSVQNAGARLIFWANKYDHVPSLLRDLHWLRVLQRIDYKIAVLAYRCLTDLLWRTCLLNYRASRTCRRDNDYGHGLMVVGHVSRPYVEPVRCRRPRFPDCRCTSMELSVTGPSIIQFSLIFQASAQDRAFLTELQ